jgi:hypothetical protein
MSPRTPPEVRADLPVTTASFPRSRCLSLYPSTRHCWGVNEPSLAREDCLGGPDARRDKADPRMEKRPPDRCGNTPRWRAPATSRDKVRDQARKRASFVSIAARQRRRTAYVDSRNLIDTFGKRDLR